jgi:hypothetical protein
MLAENVPASKIEWRRDQMPMLSRAIEMGYVRFTDRAGIRYFYLTKAGYSSIGIEPLSYSPIGPIIRWFGGLRK